MQVEKITKTFKVELEIETIKNTNELKMWLDRLNQYGIYIKKRKIKDGNGKKTI